MKTSAIISYLQRKCKDWDRVALREILDGVQSYIFMSPNNYMRVIDESTGSDPVLVTVPGQLVYTLDEPTFGWDVQFIQDVHGLDGTGHGHDNEYGASVDTRPAFRTIQGNESNSAKIIFSSDPNGAEYPIECYRRPQEISSENIQLEIPQQYHIDHIIKGVVGKCEEADHGESNTWLKFEKDLAPEIKAGMNTEADSLVYYAKGTEY